MNIHKKCIICGKEFQVPHYREKTAKYCSKECANKSRFSSNNVVCTNCGKPFHMKPSRITKNKRNCGYFCSKECFNEYKKTRFRGTNNHQYGLKGNLNSTFKNEDIFHCNNNVKDVLTYCPNHPYSDYRGRVFKHRLVVEQNHSLFDASCFEKINGTIVLKKNFVVHHKDCDHSNNDVSNLEILTKGQHTSLHNKMNPMPRNKTNGQFVKRH